MSYGDYRHTADIKRNVAAEGAAKASYEIWRSEVPGRMHDVTGGTLFRARQLGAEITHVWRMHYIEGLQHDMILTFDEHTFHINRILNPDDMKIEHELDLTTRRN